MQNSYFLCMPRVIRAAIHPIKPVSHGIRYHVHNSLLVFERAKILHLPVTGQTRTELLENYQYKSHRLPGSG